MPIHEYRSATIRDLGTLATLTQAGDAAGRDPMAIDAATRTLIGFLSGTVGGAGGGGDGGGDGGVVGGSGGGGTPILLPATL